jgi:hypothetical protein
MEEERTAILVGAMFVGGFVIIPLIMLFIKWVFTDDLYDDW